MKRIFLLLVGVVAAYFIFSSAISFVGRSSAPISSTPIPAKSTISVVIDFSDKKETVSVEASTAYQALVEATKKQHVPLKIKQYDFGVFVESIDDKQNTKDKAWIYFVNGKAGTVAADKQSVTRGDTVEWRFIKPSTE